MQSRLWNRGVSGWTRGILHTAPGKATAELGASTGRPARYRFLEICVGRPNSTLRTANHISLHSDDNLPTGPRHGLRLFLDFHPITCIITCYGQFYHLLRAHPWVQQYALRKGSPHPTFCGDGIYELSSILNRPLLATSQASRTLQPLSSRGITGEDPLGGCCRKPM